MKNIKAPAFLKSPQHLVAFMSEISGIETELAECDRNIALNLNNAYVLNLLKEQKKKLELRINELRTNEDELETNETESDEDRALRMKRLVSPFVQGKS